MSTGGSADCSANCSDGSADSSAAGSAGGSAACVGSSADGSNGSGSQGLSPDTGDVEVVLILLHFFLIVKSLNSLYVFGNLQCWGGHASIYWSQKNMMPCNDHLIFASSYLGTFKAKKFTSVFQENPSWNCLATGTQNSYPEELPMAWSNSPQRLSHTQPAIHTICLHFWFHTAIFENGAIFFQKWWHERWNTQGILLVDIFQWLQKPTHHSINTIHATPHGWSQNYT